MCVGGRRGPYGIVREAGRVPGPHELLVRRRHERRTEGRECLHQGKDRYKYRTVVAPPGVRSTKRPPVPVGGLLRRAPGLGEEVNIVAGVRR